MKRPDKVKTSRIFYAGYYVNSNTVPKVLRWVPRTSLIKYAFEALSVNEFKGLEFQPSLPASAGDALEGEQVQKIFSRPFHDFLSICPI